MAAEPAAKQNKRPERQQQLAQIARAIRAELKVLFITGYAEDAVINPGHLDIGLQIMTKPFAMEALGIKIREMIQS
ncbi:MAG: hypothetical protein NVS1B6_07200 [Steroidobacteraceae bacterium]